LLEEKTHTTPDKRQQIDDQIAIARQELLQREKMLQHRMESIMECKSAREECAKTRKEIRDLQERPWLLRNNRKLGELGRSLAASESGCRFEGFRAELSEMNVKREVELQRELEDTAYALEQLAKDTVAGCEKGDVEGTKTVLKKIALYKASQLRHLIRRFLATLPSTSANRQSHTASWDPIVGNGCDKDDVRHFLCKSFGVELDVPSPSHGVTSSPPFALDDEVPEDVLAFDYIPFIGNCAYYSL